MTQLQAFLLTLAIEVPCAVYLSRVPDLRRVALLAIAASSVTHPLVWWLNTTSWTRLLALELGAVVVESMIYFLGLRDVRRALLLGLVTNALSFSVGLFLYALMRR